MFLTNKFANNYYQKSISLQSFVCQQSIDAVMLKKFANLDKLIDLCIRDIYK